MSNYELGADDRRIVTSVPNPEQAIFAARGDYRYAAVPARVVKATPRGGASIQVHRQLSARQNRTLGDDGQLEGISFKGLVKAVVKPIASVAAAVGVPGAGFVNTVVNKPKPAPVAPPPPPPPPVLARPLPKRPTPVAVPRPVKVAPDAVVKPGAAKPAMMTKKENATLAKVAADVAALKTGVTTAAKAHDTAQEAKKASQTLNARAQKLASNAKAFAAKAKILADAGDKVGATKFADQARAAEALAQNTAVAAQTAGNYAERAGNAVAAATDAGIAAAATNSEGVGGIIAKIEANPLLAAGAAALALGGAYLAFGRKKGRAA